MIAFALPRIPSVPKYLRPITNALIRSAPNGRLIYARKLADCLRL
jgi:hypothetical protein